MEKIKISIDAIKESEKNVLVLISLKRLYTSSDLILLELIRIILIFIFVSLQLNRCSEAEQLKHETTFPCMLSYIPTKYLITGITQ